MWAFLLSELPMWHEPSTTLSSSVEMLKQFSLPQRKDAPSRAVTGRAHPAEPALARLFVPAKRHLPPLAEQPWRSWRTGSSLRGFSGRWRAGRKPAIPTSMYWWWERSTSPKWSWRCILARTRWRASSIPWCIPRRSGARALNVTIHSPGISCRIPSWYCLGH